MTAVAENIKVIGLKLSLSESEIKEWRFKALKLLCNQNTIEYLDLVLDGCEFSYFGI